MSICPLCKLSLFEAGSLEHATCDDEMRAASASPPTAIPTLAGWVEPESGEFVVPAEHCEVLNGGTHARIVVPAAPSLVRLANRALRVLRAEMGGDQLVVVEDADVADADAPS